MNGIGEFFIFGLFIWSLVTICSTSVVFLTQVRNAAHIHFSRFISLKYVFPFQKSMNNSNPMAFVTACFITFWSFIIIALICELGERITERFHLFNDKLNRHKWYRFPLAVQRMLLIFMCDAQQPAFVRGFGSIICTRDSFKAVKK